MTRCTSIEADRNSDAIVAMDNTRAGWVGNTANDPPASRLIDRMDWADHVCISSTRPDIYLLRPEDREMLAFDRRDGRELWRNACPGLVFDAALAADHYLFVISEHELCTCYDARSGEPLARLRIRYLAAESGSPMVAAFVRSTSARRDAEAGLRALGLIPVLPRPKTIVRAPFRSAFVDGGVVIVDSALPTIQCVNLDGSIRWTVVLPKGRAVDSMMASPDRTRVIVREGSLHDPRVDYCIWLDANTGAELDRRDTPLGCRATEAACGGTCFVGLNGVLDVATMRHVEHEYIPGGQTAAFLEQHLRESIELAKNGPRWPDPEPGTRTPPRPLPPHSPSTPLA